jgi:hypothetical protein
LERRVNTLPPTDKRISEQYAEFLVMHSAAEDVYDALASANVAESHMSEADSYMRELASAYTYAKSQANLIQTRVKYLNDRALRFPVRFLGGSRVWFGIGIGMWLPGGDIIVVYDGDNNYIEYNISDR